MTKIIICSYRIFVRHSDNDQNVPTMVSLVNAGEEIKYNYYMKDVTDTLSCNALIQNGLYEGVHYLLH